MSHVLPKGKKKMVSGNSWAAAVSRSWFVSHRNESRLTGENKKVVSGDSWASAVSRSMFVSYTNESHYTGLKKKGGEWRLMGLSSVSFNVWYG